MVNEQTEGTQTMDEGRGEKDKFQKQFPPSVWGLSPSTMQVIVNE